MPKWIIGIGGILVIADSGWVEHLDATDSEHHGALMRTTLTLDDDVAEKLKELAARQKTSFNETLNAVLRRGLTAQVRGSTARKPFRIKRFRSAFRTGVDPLRLNQLSDDLDADRAIEPVTARGRQ